MAETLDPGEATQWESNLPVGPYMVTITQEDVSDELIAEIQERLITVGGVMLQDTVKRNLLNPNQIVIRADKFEESQGIGQWQLIIPLIVPLVITGAAIFGVTQLGSITSALSKFIVPIALIGIGGFILILVAAKPYKETLTEAAKRL